MLYYANTEITQLIAENRKAQGVSVKESDNLPKSSEHPTNEDDNVR